MFVSGVTTELGMQSKSQLRTEHVAVVDSIEQVDGTRRRPDITMFGLLISFSILVLLAALVLPTYWRGQAQGRLSACSKSGLHNIGTALRRYAADFDGAYPATLSQLTPNYLREIPTCPENESSYVYLTGKVGRNKDGHLENYYFLQCQEGHPSLATPPGYPQYDSEFGLMER